MEVCAGDARSLPFQASSFDVVVSNFVLHEMDSTADREMMLREIVRVLKPGGRVALVDFVFTGECVKLLRAQSLVDADRDPMGRLPLLTLGLMLVYLVTGSKPA